MEFFLFVSALLRVLWELYTYARAVASDASHQDPEKERQLAMRLVREAMDEAARREIPGP